MQTQMNFEIYRAEELELIDGCRKRESVSQRRLYDRYSGKMFGLCRRYVKNVMAAEDVLVTAFTKVFNRVEQYKGEGSFEGWIRRIVINEALTYLRRNQSVYLETSLEVADREPDYAVHDVELHAEDIRRMVEELPPGYRMVFNLYAVDGYSHKEIADMLHITEGTSKSQLNRARGMLKRMLIDNETRYSHESDGSAT